MHHRALCPGAVAEDPEEASAEEGRCVGAELDSLVRAQEENLRIREVVARPRDGQLREPIQMEVDSRALRLGRIPRRRGWI
jgi:hypothetical protein